MNAAEATDRMRQVIRRQHKALATEDSVAEIYGGGVDTANVNSPRHIGFA